MTSEQANKDTIKNLSALDIRQTGARIDGGKVFKLTLSDTRTGQVIVSLPVTSQPMIMTYASLDN